MNHPEPSLESLLGLSVELAETMKEADAMARHPSASGDTPGVVLTAADRCDRCGAAALYRAAKFGYPEGTDLGDDAAVFNQALDFCAHHWSKFMPTMSDSGWRVTGTNPDLLDAMYGGDRRA